jgi:hypothetical protein
MRRVKEGTEGHNFKTNERCNLYTHIDRSSVKHQRGKSEARKERVRRTFENTLE